MGLLDLSRELMRRCEELAAVTEEQDRLTRTLASPAVPAFDLIIRSAREFPEFGIAD